MQIAGPVGLELQDDEDRALLAKIASGGDVERAEDIKKKGQAKTTPNP